MRIIKLGFDAYKYTYPKRKSEFKLLHQRLSCRTIPWIWWHHLHISKVNMFLIFSKFKTDLSRACKLKHKLSKCEPCKS